MCVCVRSDDTAWLLLVMLFSFFNFFAFLLFSVCSSSLLFICKDHRAAESMMLPSKPVIQPLRPLLFSGLKLKGRRSSSLPVLSLRNTCAVEGPGLETRDINRYHDCKRDFRQIIGFPKKGHSNPSPPVGLKAPITCILGPNSHIIKEFGFRRLLQGRLL